ncbi:MAG: DNA starvation/stationary phase protection protein Dps [Acidobacteria bacterium]|nr:MAG: DNA starvation/stationary phase protection protein Dps [Acidobacteriota bacterium]
MAGRAYSQPTPLKLRNTDVKTKLIPTQNALREPIRRAMIDLLNQQLADVLDLGLQAKQAHWNVKGPHFIGLHELFDKVAEELEEFTDDMAERAVELGGVALGTIQIVSKKSGLSAYPLNLTSGQKHVAALSGALEKFGTTTRAAIDSAAKAGDADTADLFTEVSRGVDKLLWMVEAHVQSKD